MVQPHLQSVVRWGKLGHVVRCVVTWGKMGHVVRFRAQKARDSWEKPRLPSVRTWGKFGQSNG